MHEPFHFKIFREDLGKRYSQSRAMHIMAGIILLVYGIPFFWSNDWTMILGFTLPALMVISVSLFKKKNLVVPQFNQVFRILEIGFLFIAAENYSNEHKPLIASFFTLAAIFLVFILWLEHRLFNPQYIVFEENEVIVPGSFKDKKYDYQDLAQIVLRTPFLTFQFKNQEFSQLKIHQSYDEFDIQRFEVFCQQKLHTI
ncbi:MAG: hypothetical protein KA198_06965 [Chitinophagaceae bacterium]|nr:hypothetical protein [Chitinophagaceae bacterium]